MLQNAQLNVLRHMSWQLAGGKKKDRPDPFWLPGLIPPSDDPRTSKPTVLAEGDRMTIEEMDAWLAGQFEDQSD